MSASTQPARERLDDAIECDLLAEIAARATTLDERLATDAAREQDGHQAADSLLQGWFRNVSQGSQEIFERRLAWDDPDPGLLRERLRVPAPMRQLPSWMSVLQSAYGWGVDRVPASKIPSANRFAPMPFDELLTPLLDFAAEDLRRRTPLSHALLSSAGHDDFERALLGDLTRICAQALFHEFAAQRAAGEAGAPEPSRPGPTRDRYRAFVASMRWAGLLRFFRKYPVAARLCARTTTNWIDATAEFLERLHSDRGAIAETLAPAALQSQVVGVQLGISDAHCGARAVAICRFADGTRVVYKPRPVALEEFFAHLVRWFNQDETLLPLRTVRVLDRTTHGWLEWIGPEACSDAGGVQRFYRRTGLLLGLLHSVGASDVHAGNLLASCEHPVLIDAETLLTHKFELEANGPPRTASMLQFYEGLTTDAVTHVALLPQVKAVSGGHAVELGGLTIAPTAGGKTVSFEWCDVNTDAMRLAPQVQDAALPRNLPVHAGRPVVAESYGDEVAAGFREAHDSLVVRRQELLGASSPLTGLAAAPVRFLFRNTTLYAALIERTLHPTFLQDGAARSLEFEVLTRPLLKASSRPNVWPLLREERDALEQLDVPLFVASANALDVVSRDGTALRCFEASASSEMCRKIQGLDAVDKHLQLQLIRAAFAAVSQTQDYDVGPFVAVTAPPATAAEGISIAWLRALRARARAEAERLAHLLIEGASFHGAIPVWRAPVYLPSARRHNAEPGRPGLWDGSAGIGMALAAVGAVCESRDIAAVARATLTPLCASVDDLAARLRRDTWDVGIGTGVGSCAYGLLRASELLSDPSLARAALAFANLIDPANLSTKGADDLIAGRAGALLLLIRMYETQKDPATLGRASALADALLARRVHDPETGLKIWRTRVERAEVGFAHGQSGIALALSEAAHVLGRSNLREAACDALTFERHLLRQGNDNGGLAAGWGVGLVGVGLARAKILSRGDDAAIREDLEHAVAYARRHEARLPDNLFDGIIGHVELLVAAADTLGSPELLAEALRLADSTLTRATQRGSYHLGWQGNYQHPGLVQGLAGVAHAWARLAAPRRVRCLAGWE